MADWGWWPMIVSHSRKFIFLKTRKTAGTSLEIALSKYCGPDDILTPIDFDEEARREHAGRGAQNYTTALARHSPADLLRLRRDRERATAFREHMMGVEARKRLGARVWDEYFKFTIVRDPFDRMLSRFFWSMKARPAHRETWRIETLDQFLRYRAEYVNENWLIYTRGDELMVDDVVRYENLEEDLGRISERIGLDHNLHEDMRQIRAKSDFRPGKESGREASVIDESAARIIGDLCSKEIEAFYPSRAAE
jgi:hypothetical protein